MNLSERIPEITRRIVQASQPEKVILFGSYARGQASPDSDLDILIIVPDERPLRQESLRVRRSLRGLLTPVDIVVATTGQINRLGNTAALIYRAALREGKVLYERSR